MDTLDVLPTVAVALAQLIKAEAEVERRDLQGEELADAVLRFDEAKRPYNAALERSR